jgi:hypothetical protein
MDDDPADWPCLEDRVVAFMADHPELDDVNDVIEALIWGEETDDDDE